MLSIIIPVYNEADSLRELHAEIDRVCQAQNIPAEVIFVDDGSSDTSWDVVEQLTKSDARVSGIRFRRNFGKSAALSAGMLAARGELILMMDADLQDDPAEIPAFLRKIDEGFDVINGWKRRRLDPWHKVYPSRVFNFLVSQLTGLWLHDHNCGLKCFRKQVAAEIRLYGELHRFVPVLAHARGFKVTELEINHRQRRFGHSKYGVRRFVRGFLDLLTVKFLTGFGQRPQHMLGAIGLMFFALGSLGLSYLAVVWLLTNIAGFDFARIGDRPALAYSIASLLLGSQMISLGFLAELIVAYTGRDADTYSVVSRIGPTSNGPQP
jgi:glycosyltransferase involved in cell wall biosynthesis